jgi:hypothetical protein
MKVPSFTVPGAMVSKLYIANLDIQGQATKLKLNRYKRRIPLVKELYEGEAPPLLESPFHVTHLDPKRLKTNVAVVYRFYTKGIVWITIVYIEKGAQELYVGEGNLETSDRRYVFRFLFVLNQGQLKNKIDNLEDIEIYEVVIDGHPLRRKLENPASVRLNNNKLIRLGKLNDRSKVKRYAVEVIVPRLWLEGYEKGDINPVRVHRTDLFQSLVGTRIAGYTNFRKFEVTVPSDSVGNPVSTQKTQKSSSNAFHAPSVATIATTSISYTIKISDRVEESISDQFKYLILAARKLIWNIDLEELGRRLRTLKVSSKKILFDMEKAKALERIPEPPFNWKVLGLKVRKDYDLRAHLKVLLHPFVSREVYSAHGSLRTLKRWREVSTKIEVTGLDKMLYPVLGSENGLKDGRASIVFSEFVRVEPRLIIELVELYGAIRSVAKDSAVTKRLNPEYLNLVSLYASYLIYLTLTKRGSPLKKIKAVMGEGTKEISGRLDENRMAKMIYLAALEYGAHGLSHALIKVLNNYFDDVNFKEFIVVPYLRGDVKLSDGFILRIPKLNKIIILSIADRTNTNLELPLSEKSLNEEMMKLLDYTNPYSCYSMWNENTRRLTLSALTAKNREVKDKIEELGRYLVPLNTKNAKLVSRELSLWRDDAENFVRSRIPNNIKLSSLIADVVNTSCFDGCETCLLFEGGCGLNSPYQQPWRVSKYWARELLRLAGST